MAAARLKGLMDRLSDDASSADGSTEGPPSTCPESHRELPVENAFNVVQNALQRS